MVWLVNKIRPDQIDSVITAELPNKEVDQTLYDIVKNTWSIALAEPLIPILHVCRKACVPKDSRAHNLTAPIDILNIVNGRQKRAGKLPLCGTTKLATGGSFPKLIASKNY